VLLGKAAGGPLERVRAEVVGGGVDEVATHGDRLRDGGNLGGVDALRRH
jgi:hypothetical protein